MGTKDIAVVAVGVLAVCVAAAQGTDFCRKASQDEARGCRANAQGDYSVSLAKCDNLADPVARKACCDKAATELKDALSACDEQAAARLVVCGRLGGAPYDPVIDPANFVSRIDNPYFPLAPGTTFVYDGPEHDEVAVTRNSKVILGVRCVEVHDVVTVNGELAEDTLDWYAQDKAGNVWYFGENAKQLAGGLVVGVEGSWTGGVDGAKPGIIMKAHPALGNVYRQEYLPDVAEDCGEVLSANESVQVPGGSFQHCVKAKDFSPLEPAAIEHKYYAPGIGNVLTVDLETGERLSLTEIRTH